MTNETYQEVKENNDVDESGYLAIVLRQRLVKRWSLMRCTEPENVLEHSSIVALLALMAGHLAVRNGKRVNILNMVSYGIVHDQVETLCTDLISPVKYATPEMAAAYGQIEDMAQARLIATLPNELREDMKQYYALSGYEKGLAKACDRYSAYIKIAQEMAAGNSIEFGDALRKESANLEKLCTEFEEIKQIHSYFSSGLSQSVDTLLGGELF
jgi:5'-deoxynucleotidase